MTLIIDSESNGYKFEADTIWCIGAYDTDKRELFGGLVVQYPKKYYKYNGKDIRVYDIPTILKIIMNADKVVGHNILQHDYPLINKLYPWFNLHVPEQVEDTFIMSSLFSPDREGGHSLESWGLRLGYPKGEYEQFDEFTFDMFDYCLRDVLLGTRVYNKLVGEM